MGRTTIRDVADAAGVSRQTVSRVLNDKPDVASDTRQRVRQVIGDLGYHPSAIARRLTHQRGVTLGVVTAGLIYVGPSRTLGGITAQAQEMGYTLLLKELPGFDPSDVQPILRSLLAQQVDGIIWAVPQVGNNRDWLDAQLPTIPVPVIFLTMQTLPDLSIVLIDNYRGGRLATEHLLQQGFRRIGHIAGPLDWWEARQRKAGWQDAMAEAGLPIADRHWQEGDWLSASGERAIVSLLDKYPEMDAVFAGNDQMALGVQRVACERGLRVPDDLAVVGFDGIPEAAYYWPPLTTVYQDQQRLGCIAVRELIRIVEADHQNQVIEPQVIWIQPEMIVRDSSVARP
jgi:LacI family transcriptional regulator